MVILLICYTFFLTVFSFSIFQEIQFNNEKNKKQKHFICVYVQYFCFDFVIIALYIIRKKLIVEHYKNSEASNACLNI